MGEIQKYNFTQERSDYLTPPILIEEIFQELNILGIMPAEIFDVDVCCSQKNVPAKRYFIDGEIDGLTAEWGISIFAIRHLVIAVNGCGKHTKNLKTAKQPFF